MLWQAPALALTARAFLLTIALGGNAVSVVWEAGLALFALANIAILLITRSAPLPIRSAAEEDVLKFDGDAYLFNLAGISWIESEPQSRRERIRCLRALRPAPPRSSCERVFAAG
jgi:hypothetical protein